MLLLLSCGSNARGQLGNLTLDDAHGFFPCAFDIPPPGNLPLDTAAVLNVATGANHTLVLLEKLDGEKEIWACGDGSLGQLGSAYKRNFSTTTFRKLDFSLELRGHEGYSFKFVGATWETSYVVLSRDGSQDLVLAMGSNDFGDLGAGTVKRKEQYNIIFQDNITAMYTGQRHVILRLGASKLVGWGASRHGQLGDTAAKPCVSSPHIISLPAADQEPIRSVSLGAQHTVILYESGRLYTLGSNRKHQLDAANASQGLVSSLACTWNGTYIAQADTEGKWDISSSGNNSHSQLGWSAEDATVGKVSFPSTFGSQRRPITLRCGSEHVVAVVDGEVWGWGWNEHGNLGLLHTNDVVEPTMIWPPAEPFRGAPPKIFDAWGGMGTTWICMATVEDRELSESFSVRSALPYACIIEAEF